MSEIHSGGSACSAIQIDGGNTASLGAAGGLCLAAAPTFAIMGLLTGVLGSPDMICSASPLSGMAVMYAMMSASHAAPWLALISAGRRLPVRNRALTNSGLNHPEGNCVVVQHPLTNGT